MSVVIERAGIRKFGAPPRLLQRGDTTFTEGFTSKTQWAVFAGVGVIDDDTTNYRTEDGGVQSVKLTIGAATSCAARKTIAPAFVQPPKMVDYWLFVPWSGQFTNLAQLNAAQAVRIGFYDNNAATVGWSHTVGATDLLEGWNHIQIMDTDWVQAGSPVADWSGVIRMVIRIAAVASSIGNVSFDALRCMMQVGQPGVMITFADNHQGHYSRAFPVMRARGMRGNVEIVTGTVDAGGDNPTWAQLRELQRHGWCITNQSQGGNIGTAGGLTEAQIKTDLDGAYSDLTTRGLRDKAARVVWIPSNDYLERTLNVLTGVSNAMAPAPLAIHAGLVTRPVNIPHGLFTSNPHSMQSGTSFATVKGWIDTDLAAGAISVLGTHNVVASGATGDSINASFLAAVVNYIAGLGVPVYTEEDLVDLQTVGSYVRRNTR